MLEWLLMLILCGTCCDSFQSNLNFFTPLSTWVLTNNDIGTYIIIHCTKRQWKKQFGLFFAVSNFKRETVYRSWHKINSLHLDVKWAVNLKRGCSLVTRLFSTTSFQKRGHHILLIYIVKHIFDCQNMKFCSSSFT